MIKLLRSAAPGLRCPQAPCRPESCVARLRESRRVNSVVLRPRLRQKRLAVPQCVKAQTAGNTSSAKTGSAIKSSADSGKLDAKQGLKGNEQRRRQVCAAGSAPLHLMQCYSAVMLSAELHCLIRSPTKANLQNLPRSQLAAGPSLFSR